MAKITTLLKVPDLPGWLAILRDWQVVVRSHFLFAAVDTGLLEALREPRSKAELTTLLHVERPEILDALLELGVAVGELAVKNGRYRLKGKRALALIGDGGDGLFALIEANATYYNSVYREAAGRLRGGENGAYLEQIGDIVARFSQAMAHFEQDFVRSAAAQHKPLRILDVGCGAGEHLRYASEANPQASGTGIDIDQTVVERAQANLKAWDIDDRFTIIRGDIRQPPAELHESYDLILLLNSIYYFTVQEREELLSSLYRRLAPGGKLLLASGLRGEGVDAGTANLNMATSSIQGCTPLPELIEVVQQLRETGFADIKTTKLLPGGLVYGITVEKSR